jgi:hypothetical protein
MSAHRLRRALFVSALLAAIGAVCMPAGATRAALDKQDPGTWCGGTLWRLMNLSDPDRATVDLHGTPTTIADIAKRVTPGTIGPRRTTKFQHHVWRLRAVIDRYRIASNGEIVLILFSIDTGQYMNAYLPNPHCLGPRARDRTGMIAARNELTSHCPTVKPSWELLGITVELAGVGFWNPRQSTRGALPNGAELRPLTNFKIVTGCGIAQS